MNELTNAGTIDRSNIDIGLIFRQGWRRFIDDIGVLLIATLIAIGLTIVSLGILGGPLLAGLYGMVNMRLRDGRRPEIGDVFAGFSRFWSYFGAGLALLVLIGLASITIIGGVLLATIWLYVFPLMVDRGIGLGEAMKASKDLVMQGGFWEHLALVILLIVIHAAAPSPLGIVVLPFTIVTVGVAYFAAQGRDDVVPAA
jgi:hypothetical protein